MSYVCFRQSVRLYLLAMVTALGALVFALAPTQLVGASDYTVSTCDESHFRTAVTSALAGSGNRVLFTCDGAITLTSGGGGAIAVTNTLTIDGTGHGVTIDGGSSVQLFSVNSGVTFTVNNLTLSHGAATNGGAIANKGTLVVANSTLSNNTASGFGAGGGALYNPSGTVTIRNSTFSGNSVADNSGSSSDSVGGAIYSSGSMTIANSTISGNSVTSSVGSGVRNAFGGGIYTRSTLTITNSTISGNSATATSGGSPRNAGGGGIEVDYRGTLAITNSTVSGNSVSGANTMQGAGIDMDPGSASAANTLIVDNLVNGTGGASNDVYGSFTTNTHNLTGSFTFADGTTGTLADNGGPTQTLAINASDTTAYQQGDLATCQATSSTGPSGTVYTGATAVDQRGAPRVVSNACSIGAFEPGSVQTTTTLTANPATGGSYGTSVILTATVSGVLGGTPPDATNAVTFKNGSTTLGAANLASGAATFTTTTLGPNNSVTATYAGATTYAGSTSSAVAVPISTVSCTVTSTADTMSATGTIATLRDAVNAANNGGCTSNMVSFDTTAFPAQTATTITLTSDTPLTLSASAAIDGTGHHVIIDGHCTLTNNACTGGGTTVFRVNSGVTANLTALTIQHGDTGNIGAGIYSDGTLTVTNSTVSGNTTSATGGGISTSGTLTLTNSTISDNTATGLGGGIYGTGTLIVTNSTVSGNTTSTNGGGIFSVGTLTVTNSTISGNTASTNGGGIHTQSTVTVTNSTVSGNTAGSYGGGINQQAGAATLTNTLIAGNSAGNNGSDYYHGGGPLTDDGHNLVQSAPNVTFNAPGDISGQSAKLGPLGSYGGTTQTLPLLPGSPALSSGDSSTCASTPVSGMDQRGQTRPGIAGIPCDIGAFESQGFTVAKTSGDSQSKPISTAFAALTATVTSKDSGVTVNGGALTFTLVPGSTGVAFGSLTGTNCTAGSSSLIVNCTLTGSGVATSPTLTGGTTAGGFTVTASAEGGSVTDATFTETVVKGIPTTAVTSSSANNTSTVGQSVTFTATVTSGMGTTPTGSVTFTTGGMTIGTAPLNGSGVANVSTSNLTAGDHTITATYSGDANYGPGTAGAVIQVVLAINVAPQATPHATGQAMGTPHAQPAAHATATPMSTPAAQPGRH